jgi:asparagine synthase (glutamine-hydrolysing)
MSGFFGVFSPSGKIDRHAFEQMQKTIQREGYEELETHLDEHIAMGHLMLRVTPESNYDKQPLKSTCGKYLLVGHFRLDYRDEIGDKLGLTQKELYLTSDSVLVMMAYQKWGEKCVNHLEGDWAFVLNDLDKNTVLCFKDKYGTSALFYARHGECFYFGTSTNFFTSISQYFSEVDLHQLYRISIPGVSFEKNRTLLRNVFRLSPCSYLKISPIFNQLIVTYFVFSNNRNIKFKDEIDYILNFRSLFSTAVKNKIRGIRALGTFQSSGLDSNSILYFISKEFEHINSTVNTYTSCNIYLEEIDKKYHPLISDDLMYKGSLHQYKNVNAQFFPFKDVSFSKEFQDSYLDFNNPLVTKSKFWVKGIMQKAKSEGLKLMITGQLGNFTITWNKPSALISDLVNLHLISTIREIRAIAKQNNKTFFYISWLHIFKPLISYLYNFFSFQFGFRKNKLEKESIFFHPLERKINWGLEFGNSLSPIKLNLNILSSDLQKKTLEVNADVTGERWYCEGIKNGLIIADPTIDIRLVDFLLNIPSKYYYFNGKQKYLFRKAFEGRLTEEILNNNYTIHQSFDLYKRMLEDPFFDNFTAIIEAEKANNNIFKAHIIIESYNSLKKAISISFKNWTAIKTLHDLSIVYLYNKLKGEKV